MLQYLPAKVAAITAKRTKANKPKYFILYFWIQALSMNVATEISKNRTRPLFMLELEFVLSREILLGMRCRPCKKLLRRLASLHYRIHEQWEWIWKYTRMWVGISYSNCHMFSAARLGRFQNKSGKYNNNNGREIMIIGSGKQAPTYWITSLAIIWTK